ncbi:tripartite tricarboxylate transporter substrate binding protein [Microbacteriaceae bacterium K1510]|nr:tripartite tricarboxylate transporter substrate binding protein [Microbacteriaceae bacterium K1510]
MKHIVKSMLVAVCAAGFAANVHAAEWPSERPIRVLVGFGAGGGTDIVSRVVAQPLSELLHQSVVVENKPGAGGSIASEQVAKAAPDGYTASMLSAGHTISAVMLKSLRYDAVKDFAPVSWVADSAFVIVARKDFPANDIKSLVALAKASPGKLNFASVGVGSTQHFAGELLRQMTGIDVKHIPYRGTPAVVAALRAGEVDYAVELVHAVLGQVQAGDLKLIAVATPQRWPIIPDTPTVAESGVPSYAVLSWYGFVYPAGTPQPIIDKTNAALKEILSRPDIREKLAKVGAVVHVSTPAEFGEHLAADVVKWKDVRDKAGLQPE